LLSKVSVYIESTVPYAVPEVLYIRLINVFGHLIIWT
jgi:hypothetical protein